jgi:hypothetical protein
MDGLFTCHVVHWRRIPPNQTRGKLFPYLNSFALVISKRAEPGFFILGAKT